MKNYLQKTLAKNSSNSGFTLVELLVVISIIGVLASLLLVNFVGVRGRAADAKRKNDLRQLKTALRLYYNDFQNYPLDNGTNTGIAGCGVDGDANCGGDFSAGTGPTIYMNEIPAEFEYYTDGQDSFVLQTELENASDETILESQTRCNPGGKAFYTGTVTTLSFFMCED